MAGGARYDLALERVAGRETIKVIRRDEQSAAARGNAKSFTSIMIAPAFPLDAQVRSVTVNGRAARFEMKRVGDVQRSLVTIEGGAAMYEIVYTYDEGTEVYVEPEPLRPGASNQGLRVLRSSADANGLNLVLEGLGGRSYQFSVRSGRKPGGANGVKIVESLNRDTKLLVSFDGAANAYARRRLTIPLLARNK
jgi:hypothetical protein